MCGLFIDQQHLASSSYIPRLTPTSSAMMSSSNSAHVTIDERDQMIQLPGMSGYYGGGGGGGVLSYGNPPPPSYHYYGSIHGPPETRETILPRVPSNNSAPPPNRGDAANRHLETRPSLYFPHGMSAHMIPHEAPPTMVQWVPTDWPQYRVPPNNAPPILQPQHYSSTNQSMLASHHMGLQQAPYQPPLLEGGVASPTRMEGAIDPTNTSTQKR